MSTLPITPFLEEIEEAFLSFNQLIIDSTPGSGKTTQVPKRISKLVSGRVIVLAPRKMAVKFASMKIARDENWKIGEEIGYAFRFDHNYNNKTKILFMTEGSFLRHLLSNPHLEGVSAVILDEFHERHLDTDVAFAYLTKLQKMRIDLKLMIMSATTNSPEIMSVWRDAKLIKIETAIYQQTHHYLPHRPEVLKQELHQKLLHVINDAMAHDGDLLIFLPGMKEILKIKTRLEESGLSPFILHGDLTQEEQDAVMRPLKGSKKIILSTNIAESSLTIPGVRVVIDSGEKREVSLSNIAGIKTLLTKSCSKASIIQRSGRAAREGDGHIYHLYSLIEYNDKMAFDHPEITRSDLASLLLLMTSLGLSFSSDPFLTLPAQSKIEEAADFLSRLDFVKEGVLTSLGKEALSSPLPPRLAKCWSEIKHLGKNDQDALLQFMLSDYQGYDQRELRKRLKLPHANNSPTATVEKIIFYSYQDQVAQYDQKKKKFLHQSGIELSPSRDITDEGLEAGLYVITNIEYGNHVTRVFPIEEDWLLELSNAPLTTQKNFNFNEEKGEIILEKKDLFGKITLAESRTPLKESPQTKEEREACTTILKKYLDLMAQNYKKNSEWERLLFFIKSESLETTARTINHFIEERVSFKKHDLDSFFEQLEEAQLQNINKTKKQFNLSAPRTLRLHDKRELEISYAGSVPKISSYIQDFYGLKSTPLLGLEKNPLTLEFLGPHKRVMQVTRDLQSFWKGAYLEIRREYEREYPRHYWPEEPWNAKPFLLKRHLL